MYKDIILGYYQIMFREIKLEDFPEEISDYSKEINNSKLSAVHIRFTGWNDRSYVLWLYESHESIERIFR